MAFRFLIYSTGTTFSDTIVRESAIDNAGTNEAAEWSNFVIPEIQPVYLWRVTGGTDVVPNTDQNINNYLNSIAPPPEPDDFATVGFVTGITENKIDTVTGATDNVGIFLADGNLKDSGYAISGLTGGTEYNFTGSGGTQVFTGSTGDPVEIIIYSTVPTGTSVAWGNITGTLSAQTDLQNALDAKLNVTTFSGYTATTATEIDGKLDSSIFNSYTGTSQPILNSALTGVTNLGTGTTLGGVSGRNVTFKSISVLGGLSLSGDANNLIISGTTGSGAGTITGGTNGLTTNGQNIELGGSLSKDTSIDGGSSYDLNFYNLDEFNVSFGGVSTLSDFGNNGGIRYGGDYSTDYVARSLVDAGYVTGLTSGLQSSIDVNAANIVYISGQTDLKLNISDFNVYSGITDTRITNNETNIALLSGQTAAGITGATNGLTKVGQDVLLGGALTKDTTISGITHGFNINTSSILIQSAGAQGIELVDTAGADVYIESEAGKVNLIGSTALGIDVNILAISETQMLITDGRSGAAQVGLEYAADYSTTFTNESLITKRYADAIASGLIPKASVLVATLSAITLSGLQTIDGVALSNGDRVLVKDQADASTNGIYIATGGTWTRSTDFDGNVDGEVSSGNMIPIVSGDTLYSTIWVLVTPNPITVGTTDLEFTLFSSPHKLISGVGIDISGNTISVDGASLAGSSIVWSGDTFNVDPTTGNLATALALKLNIDDFNTYSGATDIRLDDIEGDITYISGITDTKLDIDIFTGYTATTETRFETIENDITGLSATTAGKLDTVVFTGYTASTVSNEIFLTHTGGTNLNVISPVAIDWDTVEISGTSFLWSGGSDIYIKEAGDYELNYHIPFNSESTRDVSIGANIVKNNSIIIDLTAAAGGGVTSNGAAGSVGLPTVIITLVLDDKLTLGAFRTEKAGTVTSSLTGSILIKKKNTLQ